MTSEIRVTCTTNTTHAYCDYDRKTSKKYRRNEEDNIEME